jgi:hypothetical protein
MKVRKQHLQLAIGALFVALAWSAVSYYARGSGRPPVPAPGGGGQPPLLGRDQPGPEQSAVRGIDPASIPAPPSVERAAESASSRDPFLFGSEVRDVKEAALVVAGGSDPLVRSILLSANRRLALIENRIVGVGDQVGDFKVVQIDRDAVIFTTAAGERRRVTIRGPVSAGAYR